MKLLLIFIISSFACTISTVVSCALQHVDSNHDGFLDAVEINTFIAENPCNARDMRTSGNKVISLCDRNTDALLDSGDANHANSCLNNPGVLALACSICDSCANQ